MFSRLGHIEFDYYSQKFAICPPTFVKIPNENNWILAGSRDYKLIESIEEFFIKKNVKKIFNPNAPQCIKIENCKDEDFETFKENIKEEKDIYISRNFCSNVLQIVPTVQKLVKNLQSITEPQHSDFQYFNPKDMHFYDKRNRENDGLYKYKQYGYNDYFLKHNNLWYKIEYNYGKFYVCQEKKLIKYRKKEKTLYLDIRIRFPELIDRALTMCSGINPSVVSLEEIKTTKYIEYSKKEYLKYTNIDEQIADNVAKILNQKIGE